MAYVPQQIPKEEENQFGRTGQTTPNPVPPQGGGSAGTGGAGKVAPGVGTSTQFGSNAAKLSDYLKANKDQVGQFGQQVAGDLTNKYNQTTGAIDQGLNQFNQQVNAGYKPYDESRANEAAKNPTDFTKNQQNVDDFKNWWSGQYGGPTNFESTPMYSDINNQVNKAVENAGLVNTAGGAGGLKSYLNNFMGGSNKTQGMQLLDTALLQRDPTAQQTIRSAAAPFQNLSSYLSNSAKKADENVGAAKANIAKNQADLRSEFTGEKGALPNFIGKLNSQVAAAQKMAPSFTDYNGVPISTASVNPTNAATLQDYSTAKALQTLLGSDYQGAINPGDSEKAGTWNPALGSFVTDPKTGAVTPTTGGQILPPGTTIGGQTSELKGQAGAITNGFNAEIKDVTENFNAAISQTRDAGERSALTASRDRQIASLQQQLQNALNAYNKEITSIGGTGLS